MGREILDSGRVGQLPTSYDVGGPLGVTMRDVTMLDDVEELGLVEELDPPGADRRDRVLPIGPMATLRGDGSRRRILVWWSALTVALVVLTGVGVHSQDEQARARAAGAALLVDLRVAQAPSIDAPSDRPVQDRAPHAAVELLAHNLGPRAVELTGLTYLSGLAPVRSGTFVHTSIPIDAGSQLDQTFQVTVPCRADGGVPDGPTTVFAQVRTADGRLHSRPVDLQAVAAGGGIFQACLGATSRFATASAAAAAAATAVSTDGSADSSEPQIDVFSHVSGGTDVMRVSLGTSSDSSRIRLPVRFERAGLSSRITFDIKPALPAYVPVESTFTIRITPVVRGCPSQPDLAAMSRIGLSIGPTSLRDPTLSLLTARAVGRACAHGAHS